MRRANRPHGFTVVELLVAVAITVVIAATLLLVTDGTLRLWRRAQDGFSTDATAEVIFDYFQRDLQGALFQVDGNTWLACDNFDAAVASHGWINASRPKPAVQMFVPPGTDPNIADARFGRSGMWLRFLTSTISTVSSAGGPIEVSYQIGRRSPASGANSDPESVRYALFRDAATPEHTFRTGYDVHAYDAGTIVPGAEYNLGTNVVDFGVWLYRREPNGGLSRIYPASAAATNHTAASAATFPDIVEVMIRILTDEGATTLSAIERGVMPVPASYAGRSDDWWWDFVTAHSRVYVRRFEVKGGAR